MATPLRPKAYRRESVSPHRDPLSWKKRVKFYLGTPDKLVRATSAEQKNAQEVLKRVKLRDDIKDTADKLTRKSGLGGILKGDLVRVDYEGPTTSGGRNYQVQKNVVRSLQEEVDTSIGLVVTEHMIVRCYPTQVRNGMRDSIAVGKRVDQRLAFSSDSDSELEALE